MNPTLLIEFLTEELPPKALARLSDAFTNHLQQGLKNQGFLTAQSQVNSYATPRRLAISITDVCAHSPNQNVREKILPVSVALDPRGQPSIPLQKKLTLMGLGDVNLEELERAMDGKTESFFYTRLVQGSALKEILNPLITEAISKLPIPKVMSYQRPNGETVHFVRPVHRIVALHGSDILPVSQLGLTAGRETFGHRFLSQQPIILKDADAYAETLEKEGKVIAHFATRKEKIRSLLLTHAHAGQVLMPESLLDEVTSLVEWPVVYACEFEPEFLQIPQECLILTMQTNQKYFAITSPEGTLYSRFLIVSNIETDNPKNIIEGNERVIRPRLADAKFFFEQDKRKPLTERLDLLNTVVYHHKLGTQAERTLRVQRLAESIAQSLNLNKEEIALAKRASLLAKADLFTDMVGEFPELQGIMGTYYAQHDGEHSEIAHALSEHYHPRFAGDALPRTLTGTIVALADKFETLVGIWGIGLAPTGEKDPFALRRHALGILRILIEKNIPLSLRITLSHATSLFNDTPEFKQSIQSITLFMFDRLKGLLRERGFSPNEIEAVLCQNPDTLHTIIKRLEAVQTFASLPEAESLAAANKRISNILKKAENIPQYSQKGLFHEDAEHALHETMIQIRPNVETSFKEENYTTTLTTLAQLRENVDSFFNSVMVMDEDLQLRQNRIALLFELHTMMNQVADISKLAN
jgi:glycyl-tRNA synthetase beta chain